MQKMSLTAIWVTLALLLWCCLPIAALHAQEDREEDREYVMPKKPLKYIQFVDSMNGEPVDPETSDSKALFLVLQKKDGELRLRVRDNQAAWVDEEEFVPLGYAIAFYTNLIKKNPKNAWALRHRGAAQISFSEFDAGMKDLDEAERLEPPEPKDNSFDRATSIGMKLKLIPAGEFLMGSPDGEEGHEDDEGPQHRVKITKPFYIGIHEVTKGQFARFVADQSYKTEPERDGKGGLGYNESASKFELDPQYTWKNTGFAQTDDHPVVNVTWNDAVAYCEWLSSKEGKKYRLPTEAEWEYACRAGTTTAYQTGDDPEQLATIGNVADGTAKAKFSNWTYAINARDGYVFTAPAGRFKSNEFGLYDMHGNVWEWCADEYDSEAYKKRSSGIEDPIVDTGSGSSRVLRGGS